MGGDPKPDRGNRESVYIGLLGTTVASVDSVDRTLSARRQRAVLACLAMRAGEPVSADRLLDAVWGEELPGTGAKAVAFQVSKLRSALEPDRSGEGSLIVTSSAGYLLDVDRDHVDVHRFDRLVTEARDVLASDPAQCQRLIEEALRLWRGRPFADLDVEPFVEIETRRLEERHLLARRTRVEAQIAQRHHADIIGDLEALIDENPLEEALVDLLMTALSRSGRTADALRAFGDLRVRLSAELGIEPSNDLRRHEQLLLEGGDELDPRAAPAEVERARPVPQPSGTITFVFTDIEGSTRLLKRSPDLAFEVFERHDALLRSAWQANNGYEVSTEGDSFFVAFDETDDAVAACAHAQRLLNDEPWPVEGGVKVRMGIHTGPAVRRRDNYVGLAIHQAARVSAAAHGGQVLVSDAATRRAQIPSSSRLTRLGRFRLRDFDQPELLFRLDADGVEANHRPIRARPEEGHNLVRKPTTFLGRDADVSQLTPLLGRGRAVSLVGPGGIGKTRLATEAAYTVVDAWPDGVWFIDLADLMDSTLVPDQIAATISAPTGDSTDRWADVIAHLDERVALLIFDNTETHLDECARILADLLARCPEVGVLATGREPLHIAGETIYRVPPLTVPAVDDDDVARIGQAPAVQLFCDRASSAHPGFALSAATAPAVARVCARLDGNPLALEIAGARVGLLSLDEIVDGLDDRFRLLRSRTRTLPERQRTMQALLDWSYRLLGEQEQTALRRLAIFGGTFSVAAASSALASDELPADTIPELVWALVDKSLVVADLADSETRYRLQESVRHYAADLLETAGETTAVAAQLASWLLQHVGPWLPADRQWYGRVGVELANLRVLVNDLAVSAPETAQQLACSIGGYHASLQSMATGIDELGAAVAAVPARTPTRVVMLTALADLHLRRADIDVAVALLEDAALVQAEMGAPEWADAAVERTRGEIALRRGDLGDAASIAQSALEGVLSTRGQARMWSLLGVARYSAGDFAEAADAFERELDAYREVGHDAYIASAHGNIAEVAMHLGDRVAAAHHQWQCLRLALALGMPVMLAYSCIVAARLAAESGDWDLATRLQASAQTGLTASGQELYAADREAVDRFLDDARSELGEQAFELARQSGAALDLAEAAGLASEVLSAVSQGDAAGADQIEEPTRRRIR